jgi:hypothetical protein
MFSNREQELAAQSSNAQMKVKALDQIIDDPLTPTADRQAALTERTSLLQELASVEVDMVEFDEQKRRSAEAYRGIRAEQRVAPLALATSDVATTYSRATTISAALGNVYSTMSSAIQGTRSAISGARTFLQGGLSGSWDERIESLQVQHRRLGIQGEELRAQRAMGSTQIGALESIILNEQTTPLARNVAISQREQLEGHLTDIDIQAFELGAQQREIGVAYEGVADQRRAVARAVSGVQESVGKDRFTSITASLRDSSSKLAVAMDDARVAVTDVKDVLRKRLQGSLEDQVEILQEWRETLGNRMGGLSAYRGTVAIQAQALMEEAQNVDTLPARRTAALAKAEKLQKQLTRAELDSLDLSEQVRAIDAAQDELKPQVRAARRGQKRAGNIQHLMWLPWQLDMAQMFGAQQAEAALQVTAGVEASQAQAAFYTGQAYSGSALDLAQRQASAQSWGQYYMGQGAALTSGVGGFNKLLANNPLLGRVAGIVAPVGTGVAYVAQAEIAARAMSGGTVGVLGAIGAAAPYALAAATPLAGIGLGYGAYKLLGGQASPSEIIVGGAAVLGSSIEQDFYGARGTLGDITPMGRRWGDWVAQTTGIVPDEATKLKNQVELLFPELSGKTNVEDLEAARTQMARVGMSASAMPSDIGKLVVAARGMGTTTGDLARALADAGIRSGRSLGALGIASSITQTLSNIAIRQPDLLTGAIDKVDTLTKAIGRYGYPRGITGAEQGQLLNARLTSYRDMSDEEFITRVTDEFQISPLAAAFGQTPIGIRAANAESVIGLPAGYLTTSMAQATSDLARRRPADFSAISQRITDLTYFDPAGARLQAERGPQYAQLYARGEWRGIDQARAGSMGDALSRRGLTMLEASNEIDRFTGTSDWGWSQLMRDQGMPELAILNPDGTPRGFWENRAIQDVQRPYQRQRQQDEFAYQRGAIARARQRTSTQPGGGWWAEDQIRAISRSEDLWQTNMGIQRMDLQIAQSSWEANEGAALQNQQRAIQRQLFEQGIRWQRTDIMVGMQRAATQRDWQLQDFSTNRNTFELQQGWQMEDIDRAIRYSSGRDRFQLMRQRERAATMANVQREQMEREESRAGIQYGWSREDAEKGLRRLDEESDLRRKLLNIDDERVKKQQQFARDALKLMEEERKHADVAKQNQQQYWNMQDIQIAQSREEEKASLDYQDARLKKDEDYFNTLTPLQEEYWKAEREGENAQIMHWAAINKQFEALDAFVRRLDENGDIGKKWRAFWAVASNANIDQQIQNTTNRAIQRVAGTGAIE